MQEGRTSAFVGQTEEKNFHISKAKITSVLNKVHLLSLLLFLSYEALSPCFQTSHILTSSNLLLLSKNKLQVSYPNSSIVREPPKTGHNNEREMFHPIFSVPGQLWAVSSKNENQ